MNVLLLNGSPNPKGCTYTILREVGEQLEKHGIQIRMFQLGRGPVYGCTGCGACYQSGRCIFEDDSANECAGLLAEADGLVVGSPVYYAGPNGALCALLDRVFYAKSHRYADKPAAAVVNCRRGGASAAFDRLNKYFTIANMPVVSSQYWNATHGFTPEEVRRDAEGMQIMRTLGENMACMLLGLQNAPRPQREEGVMTNFIR